MATLNSVMHGHFPAKLTFFKGQNYDRWCVQMKVIFRFQDVLEIVNDGVTELAANATEAQRTMYRNQKKKDCRRLFLIHQCVDANIFEKIVGAETAKGAWDTLKNAYDGAKKLKKVKLQSLRRQYELLQMTDQESIAEFFTRLLQLTNQMKYCGEIATEVMKIEKILRTLTPNFDQIVVAIDESKDISAMKLEELKVTGKALVLDEIINYVRSLQNQVEFSSMKLASVNPIFFDLEMDLDTLLVSSSAPDQKLNSIASPSPSNQVTAFADATTTLLTTTSSFPAANNDYLLDYSSPIFQQGQRSNFFLEVS